MKSGFFIPPYATAPFPPSPGPRPLGSLEDIFLPTADRVDELFDVAVRCVNLVDSREKTSVLRLDPSHPVDRFEQLIGRLLKHVDMTWT